MGVVQMAQLSMSSTVMALSWTHDCTGLLVVELSGQVILDSGP